MHFSLACSVIKNLHMNRAVWKYYLDLTKFNVAISLLLTSFVGPDGGIFSFLTGGMILSLIAYSFFHGNEYYLYYNLGLTKVRLVLTSYLINVCVAVLLGATFLI
jgi:hypothetical protein